VVGVRGVLSVFGVTRMPFLRGVVGVAGVLCRIASAVRGVAGMVPRRGVTCVGSGRGVRGVAGVGSGRGVCGVDGMVRMRGVSSRRRMARVPGRRRVPRVSPSDRVRFVTTLGGVVARVLRVLRVLRVVLVRDGRGARRPLALLRRRGPVRLAAPPARAERDGCQQDGSNQSVHRVSVT
jgi:hypothetical protein